MRFRIYLIYLCVLLLVSNKNEAQQYISESENYDCTYSKEIVLPFDYNKSGENIKPQLNQIVFYSHRDQFSYWYKIIAKESTTIRFKVEPIDPRDNYTIFVYQYDKSDFCYKVYHHKIEPVKPIFFANKEARADPFSLNSEKAFTVLAGKTYYISILNVSINNCGHTFKLRKDNAVDTVKIRAIHIPCERDVSIASVSIDLNKMFSSDLQIQNDTIKKLVVAPPTQNEKVYVPVKCMIGSSKKGKITNPKLKIVDELTGDEVPLAHPQNEEYRFNIEPGKNYKVECNALGYKHFDRSIRISDQLEGNDNLFKINLVPLKVGDNFVMKNIYFHPNTYALRKESEQDLAKLLSYLLANENIKIEIQGHTNTNNKIYTVRAYSNMGNEWNFSGSAKKLSKKRAERIKEYLINNGIDEKRLVSKGYGGDRMVIHNPVTLEEGQKNIRVEVVILED